jgi:hypothetical protein
MPDESKAGGVLRFPISHEDREKFRTLSDVLDRTVNFGMSVLQRLPSNRVLNLGEAAVLLSFRHLLEMADGVSELVRSGCAEPVKPLLRSCFEGLLSMEYLLKEDTERRGVAYRVASIHSRIAEYRRVDPSTPEGRQLRKELGHDDLPLSALIPDMDTKARVANAMAELEKPKFAPVEAEWKAVKKRLGRRPAWYSLFDGPPDVRSLAIALGRGGWYEIFYRSWSDTGHAGDVFGALTTLSNGTIAMKGLRFPDQLDVLTLMTLSVMRIGLVYVVDSILPTEAKSFMEFGRDIRPRDLELMRSVNPD